METTIETEAFKKAFGTCASIVSSRSPKEVLQFIRLQVSDDSATLTGSNIETSIIARVPVTVRKPGVALLNVDRMTKVLRETSTDKIDLFLQDNDLGIHAENAQFKLPTANPTEFPVPSLIDGSEVVLPSELLRNAIRKTAFACDPDSGRYALGGIKFEQLGEAWYVIGTDGRRLACVKIDGQASNISCIVPQRPAQLIEKLLDEETAVVNSNLNNFQVTCGNYTLVTSLVEGRFPSWQQVLPDKTVRYRAVVAAGVLMHGIRQAAIVADAETRSIEFRFTEGAIDLTSSATERGKAAVTVPVEYSGEKVAINLDHAYAVEFLRTCDPEEPISVYVASASESVLLEDSTGAMYVIMPMKKS